MLLQKFSVTLLFSLFLIFAFTVKTDACSCAGPRNSKNFQPCGIFWNADVIFIGTAEKVSIEQIGTDKRNFNSRMIVRFSVEKPIRGVDEKIIEIETSPSTASCGYPFKEGERYFTYLRRGENGKLTESLCGPTVLLKKAADDLKYLNAVENGDKGGKIYGNVFQTVRKSFIDKGEYLPVEGTKITLSSVKVIDATGRKPQKYKKLEFQTESDERGFYIFQNVPAGLYKVRAEFQNGLRELFTSGDESGHYVSIDEDKRRCNGYSFNSTTQGSLEGSVLTSDGKTPPQQYISLIPLDENGEPFSYSPSFATWINKDSGKFFFNVVPPGKNLLAVNPQNCPKQENSEFGKTFFPSVGDKTQSEIISISEKERKIVPKFRLMPTLEERLFSGTVLAADGKPVNGAKVFMLASNECQGFSELAGTKTDEFGRFQLKGFETYKYKIRAYIEKPKRLYSDMTEIPSNGNLENIELIVSKEY